MVCAIELHEKVFFMTIEASDRRRRFVDATAKQRIYGKTNSMQKAPKQGLFL